MLNEADTVGSCIGKAQQALSENDISGEIIVADNASTDGSPTIARSMGARVIEVKTRGYGNSLMEGIERLMANISSWVTLMIVTSFCNASPEVKPPELIVGPGIGPGSDTPAPDAGARGCTTGPTRE